MVHRKDHTPEALAQARHLYERTLAPVEDIAAMLGCSRSNFYRHARAGNWKPRRAREGTFQFARAMLEGMAAAEPGESAQAVVPAEPTEPTRAVVDLSAERAALAARIQQVVEREMDAVERILATLAPTDHGGAEHCARTLTHVSRTVREIAALNQPNEVTPADAADDDPVPSDIDEFRFELARRIHQFIEHRQAGVGALPGGEGGALD
jgi:AcrR family transcriptional regulator